MEIGKGLYWDENKNKRNNNFNRLKGDIEKLVSQCAAYVSDHLVSMAAD